MMPSTFPTPGGPSLDRTSSMSSIRERAIQELRLHGWFKEVIDCHKEEIHDYANCFSKIAEEARAHNWEASVYTSGDTSSDQTLGTRVLSVPAPKRLSVGLVITKKPVT